MGSEVRILFFGACTYGSTVVLAGVYIGCPTGENALSPKPKPLTINHVIELFLLSAIPEAKTLGPEPENLTPHALLQSL